MGNNDAIIVLLVGGVAVGAWYLYNKSKKKNRIDPFENDGKLFGGIETSKDGKYEYTKTDPFSVKAARVQSIARAFPARVPKIKKARRT